MQYAFRARFSGIFHVSSRLFEQIVPAFYLVACLRHHTILSDKYEIEKEARAGFPHVANIMFLIEVSTDHFNASSDDIHCTYSRNKIFPSNHQAYQEGYYYFETVECVRRLILASVVGIIADDSTSQPVLGLLVCYLFCHVYTDLKPYRDRIDNMFAVALNWSLALLFLAALLIKLDSDWLASNEGSYYEDDENSEGSGSAPQIFSYLLIVVRYF